MASLQPLQTNLPNLSHSILQKLHSLWIGRQGLQAILPTPDGRKRSTKNCQGSLSSCLPQDKFCQVTFRPASPALMCVMPQTWLVVYPVCLALSESGGRGADSGSAWQWQVLTKCTWRAANKLQARVLIGTCAEFVLLTKPIAQQWVFLPVFFLTTYWPDKYQSTKKCSVARKYCY